MAGAGLPPGIYPSLASRSRSEMGRSLLPGSLHHDGLPPGAAIATGVFTLARHLLLFMIAFGVIGILLVLFRGLHGLPSGP